MRPYPVSGHRWLTVTQVHEKRKSSRGEKSWNILLSPQRGCFTFVARSSFFLFFFLFYGLLGGGVVIGLNTLLIKLTLEEALCAFF